MCSYVPESNLCRVTMFVSFCHFVGFVRKSKSFVSDSDSEGDREENVPVEFREEDVVGVEEEMEDNVIMTSSPRYDRQIRDSDDEESEFTVEYD